MQPTMTDEVSSVREQISVDIGRVLDRDEMPYDEYNVPIFCRNTSNNYGRFGEFIAIDITEPSIKTPEMMSC
jgi:hypothetical protein